MTAIGINGFGRTGRQLLRASLADADFKLCAINDAFLDAEQIAHFIRFDTTAGRFSGRVEVKNKSTIAVDGNAILIYHIADPLQVPWSDAGVNVVLEASGVFSTSERAAGHLNGGAHRVAVCGPSPDLPVIICGVNETTISPKPQVFCSGTPILSALTPLLKILQEGLQASFTTSFVAIQPPMSSQKCTDAGGIRDMRMARGQSGNLIAQSAQGATHSGAANASTGPNMIVKTVSKLLPRIAGRVGGTFVFTSQTGASFLDVTLAFDKPVTLDAAINSVKEFISKSDKNAKIAAVETAPVVSSDFTGSQRSFTVDVGASCQVTETVIKLCLWVDTDVACARRVLDILRV